MSKLLPGKRVAEMNFDKRDPDGKQRIAKRDAGMRKCPRIQNDEIDAVAGGLLYPIDELVFGVTLETGQRMPELLRQRLAAGLDVRETRATVNFRFA